MEGEHFLAHLGHIYPHGDLADPFAFYLVGLQEVLPGIAVETADAKVLPTPVLVLFVEKLGQVLDPGVMEMVIPVLDIHACLLVLHFLR